MYATVHVFKGVAKIYVFTQGNAIARNVLVATVIARPYARRQSGSTAASKVALGPPPTPTEKRARAMRHTFGM